MRKHFFLLVDSFVTVTRIELLKVHFVTKIGMLRGSFEMMRGNFVTRMMKRRESSVMRMLKFGKMEPSFVLRQNSARRA